MAIRDAQDLKREADGRGLRRVLLVTALGLEMDAVRAHLTEPCSVIGGDGSVYECGVFSEGGQDWLVVVVETGAGTHPAQSAVQHAHFLMGEFELQILVGIGGSRKEDDAPIGSVVASERVYMPYGGKDTDRGMLSRPRELPVDGRLLGLAKKVRRDGSWPNRIRGPFGGALPEIYPVAMPPIGHVAPIASVEAVVAGRKSGLEVLLARDYNDTCVVEMEGYGAASAAASLHTPSIVIRGVSDLAMNKTAATDKSRQPVAACHAAAFGFELLALWGENYLPTPRLVQRGAGQPSLEAPPQAIAATSLSDDQGGGSPRDVADARPPRVVLNLDLDPATLTPEMIAEWQRVLRDLAGTKDVTVVGTEPGSVRLIIEDPTGALSELDLSKLREGLENADGTSLLGRVQEPEYRQLGEIEQQLQRASADLMSWPTKLPDGEWIDRPELARLAELVRTEARSTTALLGGPGSGKSALLATFSKYVTDELRWPLLAIKADLLPPEVSTEDQLASYLDLPDRPSALLSRLSKLRPAVLVIDQLDALAGYLDLRTGRLNVLMNLVRKLGEVDNVHIVLSSRTFEFEHDVRLKTIRAQDLRLELPSWPKVSEILLSHGVQADGWPEDAQQVMRSPQALTTYLGLDRAAGAPVFDSYQAMLERLWAERVVAGDRGAARSKLVSELAGEMASTESLWLPRIRYEDHEADVKALESAGILTPLGGAGSLGFTHQTLFDHALARSFARGAGRLSSYVLERQTSLFLRPKLWAALTYLRAVDPSAYSTELESIWTTQGLRQHLRFLLIDFIGQQGAPSDREVLLMDRALADVRSRATALKALSGSAGWFDRLAAGRLAEAMTTDPDIMRMVLIAAWPHDPDKVISLISTRWLPDPAHDGRIWLVLQNATSWSAGALTVAKAVLDRTTITPHFVDDVVAMLGVDQPTIALELVRSKLDRDLREALAESKRRQEMEAPHFETESDRQVWEVRRDIREPLRQLLDQGQGWETLPALAEKAPDEFLRVLWPWFLSVFAALRALDGSREGYLGYALGYDGDFRFGSEPGLDLPEPALLASLRTAVESLASLNPSAFEAWAADQASVDATAAQRLIAHVMSLDPQRWSTAALGFLLGDTRRWHLGSINDYMATTMRLIETSAELWSAEELARFEAAVLAFRPSPPSSYDTAKDRQRWHRAVRRVQLGLLKALPKARTSAAARRKVQEESRAFPGELRGVRFTGAQWVGARMDSNAMAKATDEEILNAFQTLPDATEWSHPNDWMSGGNIQLAREFATFAKEHPQRAIAILDAFTPEIGTRAAGYALDALGEDGAPEDVQRMLLSLTQRGFDGDEYRGSISTAVERLVRRKVEIDPAVISILERWLASPTNPAAGDEEESPEEDDQPDARARRNTDGKTDEDPVSRSMLWGYGGMSILPGGDYPVLSALIQVRLARKESDLLIDTLGGVLDRTSDARLWENLLHLIVYFQPGEPDRRPNLVARIFEQVPALVATKSGAHLLAYAHWWSDEMVRTQLARDQWDKSGASRQANGELVALLAIVRPQLDWPAKAVSDLITNPDRTDARTGLALTAANLWADTKHRRAATDLLVTLIPTHETGVWASVFDVFRLVEELTPDIDTVRLLSCMADHVSTAPAISASFVVERLQTLLPHEADRVGRIALGLVDIWRGDLGDMRTAHAMAAPELVDLAVTLHRLGPETRELGTKLFEELLTVDAYTARDTLDQIDSRFRNTRGSVRPRLQRRSAARRRRRG